MAKTVLVVDDAAIIRQVCAIALKREGYEIVEGENGKDALSKLDDKKIDLVITDINMPEMDGIELIRQLRARKEFKFVPIVVLSTVSQEHRVEEGKQAGASGWILKPFDANKLMHTVRKFI